LVIKFQTPFNPAPAEIVMFVVEFVGIEMIVSCSS